jgi:hypothetical protein
LNARVVEAIDSRMAGPRRQNWNLRKSATIIRIRP